MKRAHHPARNTLVIVHGIYTFFSLCAWIFVCVFVCRSSTQWVLEPTDSKTLSLQSEYVPEASGFPLKACVGIAATNNNYTCWSGLFTKESLHSETGNK